MRVLLSINPVHVENIMAGRKTYEFRRKVFARKDVKTVLIYCTRPIALIVGEFDIDRILEDEPEDLWRHTAYGSGISKDFFDSYFSGREKAYAIKIGDVRRFPQPLRPQDLFDNFTPPQSYMYVPQQGYAQRQLQLF